MDLQLWSRLGTNYKTIENTALTKPNTKYLLCTKMHLNAIICNICTWLHIPCLSIKYIFIYTDTKGSRYKYIISYN